MPTAVAVDALVDLDRYPLDDLASARGAAVVAAARAQLATSGFAELDGFLGRRGLEALIAAADRLAAAAHFSEGLGTAYLGIPDRSLPAEHPREWLGRYRVGAVAYDLFPADDPLRTLYESPLVLGLVEAVLGGRPLHRYADPFGALNLAVMGDSDELQWHFDQTDFVVSLAVRSSEAGGLFEVAPLVRSADDERFDEVAAVLGGDRRRVEVVAMAPGTLLVFEGRHSLHRVSPVEGPVSRLVGLLAYDTKPGTVGSDLLRQVRYGRTVPFDQPPAVPPPAMSPAG
ncbi:MAG: HalD/BesD family halogenase [Acidimicrobiales bacterium]